jgi:hypothetical protein
MELVIERVSDLELSPGAILRAIDEHRDAHRDTNEADGVRWASVEDFAMSAQGDVNFTRLPWLPTLDPGAIDAQLAPGQSRGSRHVILYEHMEHVEFYRRGAVRSGINADILGPVLFCKQNTIITHPEHKWLLLPAGVWGVTYQQAMMGEKAGRAID